MLEILAEASDDDDDDGPVTPAGTTIINTASIHGIDDSESAIKGATGRINEPQSEPSKLMRGICHNLLNFPRDCSGQRLRPTVQERCTHRR